MTRYLPASISVPENLHIPLTRVELHVHLDGAVRHSTCWELLRAKGLPMPGNGTLEDFKNAVHVKAPKDLMHMLSGFRHFAPAFVGDVKAIERMAFEFCEDEASNGVAYVEARFSPHLLAQGEVTPKHVVDAVWRGFQRGEQQFGVKARMILCMIRGRGGQEALETLRLCEQFRGEGVVAIDVAGDEGSSVNADWTGIHIETFEIDAFDEARRLSIHRTAHAGEAGPAGSVGQALDVLGAERIGHGYRVIKNDDLYARCLAQDVHFETCPSSSILTGSVALHEAALIAHPIVQFAKDRANFSISTDDPTITGTFLSGEYDLVRAWGLTEAHITRANFNAARSCFLPADEKQELLKTLRRRYGVDLE